MNVYFVRHGESELNATGFHQNISTKLSEKGLEQARTVAKRFKDIPVDLILTSPAMRAVQTAEEIRKVINKELMHLDLLHEIKRPTEIEEKHKDDPEVVKIKELLMQHANDPEWHDSDEDNYHDLKDRAKAFLQTLNERKEDNILVVSHGMFIGVIINTMFMGDDFTPDYGYKFNKFFSMKNTGITLCDKDEKGKWTLRTWNDHAHLG